MPPSLSHTQKTLILLFFRLCLISVSGQKEQLPKKMETCLIDVKYTEICPRHFHLFYDLKTVTKLPYCLLCNTRTFISCYCTPSQEQAK